MLSQLQRREELRTNLAGIHNLAAEAIPRIRDRAGGALVAVSSVHAMATSNGMAAYAATKGAIVAMCRGLALDHAREAIRVNALVPGSVDTPMLRASATRRHPDDPEAALALWAERQPLGRIAQPMEVAQAIAFLASGLASAITGTVLVVDAGLSARLAL
ncbi:MAG TPA: SDR family oxidoreductase [Acidimicrobiia bacterium]|nr:SDR family oxidoreductase [Acidimicrobiia bacterium]